nr:intradiol ring-cleavage dioxygenase [Fulvivirga sedimenti]
MSNRDTLPDYKENGIKMLVKGTVFKKDGKTPASDVIIYIYHTDQNGIYPTRESSSGWEKRHGYLRGWIKTGADGTFYFHTRRPAPYPGRTEPAHIHITVKEPGLTEYYLDSYHFTDDPLLTADITNKLKDFGGSGLVTPVQKNDQLIVERDIYLGRNIIDYPK